MRNGIRKWIKDEKRIVKLLYRKGFLTGHHKVDDLYWNEYKESGRRYKSGKYRHREHLPEVHYCTTDYFGESDEHSIVDTIKDMFYWSELKPWDEKVSAYPESNFKHLDRQRFIKYLSGLKTVRNDSEINKVLCRNMNY